MATPTAYMFTQRVDYPTLLQLSILAAGIPGYNHVDTSGSGAGMVVSVWCDDALTSPQQDSLNSVMASFTNPTNTASMISSISSSIASSDTNLMILLRARVVGLLSGMSYGELVAVCNLLGIVP